MLNNKIKEKIVKFICKLLKYDFSNLYLENTIVEHKITNIPFEKIKTQIVINDDLNNYLYDLPVDLQSKLIKNLLLQNFMKQLDDKYHELFDIKVSPFQTVNSKNRIISAELIIGIINQNKPNLIAI